MLCSIRVEREHSAPGPVLKKLFIEKIVEKHLVSHFSEKLKLVILYIVLDLKFYSFFFSTVQVHEAFFLQLSYQCLSATISRQFQIL